MEHKNILINILNIVFSVLTCIVMKPHMFPRSLMHFPFGSIGAVILHNRIHHGYVYIFFICLYQCMELYAHFRMYNEDYSWIDIEGYTIGFTYTTFTIMLLSENNYKYKRSSTDDLTNIV
jgi:hypothetical protein